MWFLNVLLPVLPLHGPRRGGLPASVVFPFIYAGLADRLVHPREHVLRLWEHWGRPEITWYPGGHTGFFSSRPVTMFVTGALLRSGLTAGRTTLPAAGPAS